MYLVGLLILSPGCDSPPPHAGTSKTAAKVGQRIQGDQSATPPAPGELQTLIDRVLDYTRHRRELSLERNAAWQIMHGVLAFGGDFQVRHEARQVPALQWVLEGKPMQGWTLRKASHGLRAVIEPGKNGQGHEDQWLAVVSQCDIPPTHSVIVDNKPYQIHDILTQAMYNTYEGKECSWSLIGLAQYLDPVDRSWEARDGTRWSIERMLTMEGGPPQDEPLGQRRINEGACGGTHRLIGMAMALTRYRGQYPVRELTGGWLAASKRIIWATEEARQNQLPNGAFSIHYFRRPSRSMSVGENLTATGHTLEFLSTALDRQGLSQLWVRRAVVYLCNLLEETRELDLECGALYHAAHGLVLYRQRCFGLGEPTGDSLASILK